MKILVIGYVDNFIDQLFHGLRKKIHQVRRINIHISSDQVEISISQNDEIYADYRNFHDITIEILDFEPELIVYIPMNYQLIPLESQFEVLDLIYSEFIEHLLETAQIINCDICLLNLSNVDGILVSSPNEKKLIIKYTELIDFGIKLIERYSKSSVISANTVNIDIDSLIDKITK
ncbi:MAG: hypothetical protein ACW99A_17625 [Candidatus Kariarchaeaceae archaeon]|jgi:hypothetical protein